MVSRERRSADISRIKGKSDDSNTSGQPDTDRRIDTYVKFVRAVEDEHFNAPTTDDRIIRSAEAEVALVASGPALRQAASRLAEYVLVGVNDEEEYTRRANAFLDVAHADVEALD